MTGYPLEQIYKEVAFIAYYFHWQHDQVMEMPHSERKKWCEEISGINKKLSEESPGTRNLIEEART
jgi:hypothetical protein